MASSGPSKSGCGCGTIISIIVLLVIAGDLFHGCQADTVSNGARTVDGVSLLVNTVQLNHDQSGSGGSITGTIRNTTAQPVHNVNIKYRLTDANGQYAGHATDSIDTIAGGGTWQFSCKIDNAAVVKNYEFDDMSADSN